MDLGAFRLCGQRQAGNGVIALGCARTTPISGTQVVAKITFTILTSGPTSVAMTSGSAIDGTSGGSVWNGKLPSERYTFSSQAQPETASSEASAKVAPMASGTSSTSGSSTSTKAKHASKKSKSGMYVAIGAGVVVGTLVAVSSWYLKLRWRSTS